MSEKIVVVTGGASGIGLATCMLLAQKGYKVMISDIDEAAGATAVSQIKSKGGEAVFQKADVSIFKEFKTLIDHTVHHYGQLDLLVNNAGIGPKEYKRAAEHSLEDWDKVIAVNQSGVFYGMKIALGYMVEQGFGNIVNVASLAGIRASTTGMSYAASKFAVVGLTKSAALEYGSKNIRINCVCPSFTDTSMFDKSIMGNKDIQEKLIKTVPLKRIATPNEIADAIYWLASDQSSYTTGHALMIDGGLLA